MSGLAPRLLRRATRAGALAEERVASGLSRASPGHGEPHRCWTRNVTPGQPDLALTPCATFMSTWGVAVPTRRGHAG